MTAALELRVRIWRAVLPPQTLPKVRIFKLFQALQPFPIAEDKNTRQRHSVEGVVLAHRIDRHIAEQKQVPLP